MTGRGDQMSQARIGAPPLAAGVVESLGGRYSIELGIDLDRGDDEIERWALAATLFGGRISAKIAERTFATFEDAGVHSLADAGRLDIGRLIGLLDAGGYARYDLRTAQRLHAIAEALETDYRGQVSSTLNLPADDGGAGGAAGDQGRGAVPVHSDRRRCRAAGLRRGVLRL